MLDEPDHEKNMNTGKEYAQDNGILRSRKPVTSLHE